MKRPWAFICASEGATSKHLRNYCREVYLLGYLPVCPKLQDSQYLVLEDAVERSEYTAIVRDKLLRCPMQTKGKCMYTFYIMRFFEKTHISVYDGSLKGLCKMIELILGKKLEPNHLQKVLARTNVSRLGLQYIKKNRNKILLIYRHPERYK